MFYRTFSTDKIFFTNLIKKKDYYQIIVLKYDTKSSESLIY